MKQIVTYFRGGDRTFVTLCYVGEGGGKKYQKSRYVIYGRPHRSVGLGHSRLV